MRVINIKVWFACLSIALVLAFNLYYFNLINPWPRTLTNPGFYIDALSLLFPLFIFYAITELTISNISAFWIRLGLYLWIVGQSFDLADEIVYQPKWVAYFLEDTTRLLGMFFVAIGAYKLIGKINAMYMAARVESFSDQLTQLPNRRFFIDTLREKKGTIALMIIDIDFFKQVNDTYGHIVGDEVLYNFGKLLASMIGERFFAARIGGEEFAVILDDVSEKQTQTIAATILASARKILVNNDYPLSVSMGVGIKHADETQDVLIKKVDEALYRAKRNGRGRIEWASGAGFN